jgi:formyl-CoA transferase
MVEAVAVCIRTRPAAEWLEDLEKAGIPAGPINSVSQALADVQAQHRAMVRTIAGTPVVGSPVRIDGERADSDLPPPALGEHTFEVLGELDIPEAEIARLSASGVIAG